MSSPRLTALIFKIVTNGKVDYSKVPPLCIEEDEFRVMAKGDTVRFDLKVPVTSDDLARNRVAAYITRWEIDEGLRRNSDCFILKFNYSIDDGPSPKGLPAKFSVNPSTATGVVGASRFPARPTGFTVDPIVEWMYNRYMRYRRNRDTLPSMAYFCLTVLEEKFGGDRNAAQRLQVSRNVFEEIRRLSSTRGGHGEARKAKGATLELSATERLFLEESTRQIIRRCAEVLDGSPREFQKITRADFN